MSLNKILLDKIRYRSSGKINERHLGNCTWLYMGGQVSKESDKLRSSGDKLAWKVTHTKHKTSMYVNTIQIQNTKNTE